VVTEWRNGPFGPLDNDDYYYSIPFQQRNLKMAIYHRTLSHLMTQACKMGYCQEFWPDALPDATSDSSESSVE